MKYSISGGKMRFGASLLVILLLAQSIALASAADPGHSAAAVGSGTFESGSYAFPQNLNISNNLTIGGNNLFVNNGTGRVGIGTTAPSRTLDVRGVGNFSGTVYINNGTDISALVAGADDWNISGSNLFPLSLSYNVAIGKTSASSKLDVSQSAQAIAFIANSTFGSPTTSVAIFTRPSNVPAANVGKDNALIQIREGGGYPLWITNVAGTTDYFLINSLGNVGIGTNASYKLEVNAASKGLNVSNTLFVEGSSVGIGVASPRGKLDIQNSGELNLTIDNTGSGNSKLIIDRQTTGAESKIIFQDAGSNQWGIATKATSNDFAIRDGDSTDRLTILKSNGFVGVGTASPSRALDVRGVGNFSGTVYINNGTDINALVAGSDDWNISSNNLFPLSRDYNVGIGVISPTAKLNVNGSANIEGSLRLRNSADFSNNARGIAIDPTTFDGRQNVTAWGNSGGGLALRTISTGSGSVTNKIFLDAGTGFITFATGGETERLRIDQNGQVGIGTASPSRALDVRGIGNFSGTIYINNATDISTLLGGSYNATYHAYPATWNQSINQHIAVMNASWLTTYNSSYHSGIVWQYNQTIPAQQYANTNINANVSAINTNLSSSFVPYIGANKNINLGANNLTVDAGLLHVSSVDDAIHVEGNLGISPAGSNDFTAAYPLDVFSNTAATATYGSNIGVRLMPWGSGNDISISFQDFSGSNKMVISKPTSGGNRLALGSGTLEVLSVLSGGSVGIGITSPTTKLDVAGNITVNQTIRSAAGSSDFIIDGSAGTGNVVIII